MIEYDCDARFWNPIAQKIKIKTLRNFRIGKRRHARVDEPIELWAAVGGKRLQIRKATCIAVEGVTLHIGDTSPNQVFVGPVFKNRSTWKRLTAPERHQLAVDTGHENWPAAAGYYVAHYGHKPWHGTLITWGDREYDGPLPSHPQLRDLRILTLHKSVIPAYGKISSTVAISLVVLGWAEVTDRSMCLGGQRSYTPIRITELGRWILDRFEK